MLGCILSGGNSSEFPELDSELTKRGIEIIFREIRHGGRIYFFKDEDIEKLPKDEKGPYFGDDESGHSIYEVSEELIDYLIK